MGFCEVSFKVVTLVEKIELSGTEIFRDCEYEIFMHRIFDTHGDSSFFVHAALDSHPSEGVFFQSYNDFRSKITVTSLTEEQYNSKLNTTNRRTGSYLLSYLSGDISDIQFAQNRIASMYSRGEKPFFDDVREVRDFYRWRGVDIDITITPKQVKELEEYYNLLENRSGWANASSLRDKALSKLGITEEAEIPKESFNEFMDSLRPLY